MKERFVVDSYSDLTDDERTIKEKAFMVNNSKKLLIKKISKFNLRNGDNSRFEGGFFGN